MLITRNSGPSVASFGLSLLDKINPVTNRLHTSLQIAQAKSGRFSSKNPNLQNVPRDGLVRSAVRAPAGDVLVVADYSQIELRVMAEVARDTRMRDAYARGLDLHAVTAASMLGIPLTNSTRRTPNTLPPGKRQRGSTLASYMAVAPSGLVVFARDNYNVIMSEDEARTVIDTWLRTYPDVANWRKRHAAKCRIIRLRADARGPHLPFRLGAERHIQL